MPGRGLSRKSGGPEAGCGVLIRFHGLKVPRDYKFPSCKNQPGHLLISVIKMDNTHADQIREQFFFYCTEYLNPSTYHSCQFRILLSVNLFDQTQKSPAGLDVGVCAWDFLLKQSPWKRPKFLSNTAEFVI